MRRESCCLFVARCCDRCAATEQGRDGGVLLIFANKKRRGGRKKERGVALIAVNNGTMEKTEVEEGETT